MTSEQRRKENEAFINAPCRFRQYINPDGSVGKTYKIAGGATVKINDADFIPIFEASEAKWKKEHEEFHQKLISLGVKAYRYNDGWVDRKECKAVFFANEKDKGTYWHSSLLSVGDKIFIGCLCNGGRFATITEILRDENSLFGTFEVKYLPLEETIDGNYNGEIRPYITNLNYHPTFWQRMFKRQPHLETDICSLEYWKQLYN